jgi:hypothetical protein
MRAWRKKYPGRAAYARKKWNAKKRGIEFALTLKEFLTVWEQGKVIDRINPLLGYRMDNIQILSRYENAYKGATVDKAAHQDCPF